jgi:hypothetical protein
VTSSSGYGNITRDHFNVRTWNQANLDRSAYCGMPAGLEAFRVADRVLSEMEEKGEMVREK